MQKLLLSIFLLLEIIITGCSTGGSLESDHSVNKLTIKTPTSEPTEKKDEVKKENDAAGTTEQFVNATIVKNIDGDTVKINLNGKEETIRMLCVDTPETHHPRLGVQPYGPEAANFTKKTLYVGRKVQVELGIGSGRDKYGRLLAYIYVDGKMFNEMLLERGLARVAYIYAPNTKYVDKFYTIQKVAQKKEIGIWSIENYAGEDGYHPKGQISQNKNNAKPSSNETYKNNPADDQEANLNCKGKIKGNQNSHIYHVPGGAFYDSTQDNIIWFCSEQEAEKAGFRKSKR